ncbi:hypothetical protein SCA03_25230 [Streptomyces cacaoi]|uniref:Uncharacterized protein n=1 Tax=Streptomyces cacaoi TaxID=1898 RepID=A0A4Y3QXM6_STRCI|nr:hypothetical protein SCA03_25230 [Streptomyces cacaoi]
MTGAPGRSDRVRPGAPDGPGEGHRGANRVTPPPGRATICVVRARARPAPARRAGPAGRPGAGIFPSPDALSRYGAQAAAGGPCPSSLLH